MMVKGLFGKISWKNFGIGIVVAFLAFQGLSLLLGNFFPFWRTVMESYSLIWLWVIFGLILFLIGRLVYGMKSFDKRSIFILLIAIALLSAIVIYFELDFGQLFDMSIVKSDLVSIGRYMASLVK